MASLLESGGIFSIAPDILVGRAYFFPLLRHFKRPLIPLQLLVTCSPITAGGIGQGSSCSTQPVCCTNNDFVCPQFPSQQTSHKVLIAILFPPPQNGIFALGCTPVNIAVRRDPQGALELSETSLKDFIDGSNE